MFWLSRSICLLGLFRSCSIYRLHFILFHAIFVSVFMFVREVRRVSFALGYQNLCFQIVFFFFSGGRARSSLIKRITTYRTNNTSKSNKAHTKDKLIRRSDVLKLS